MAAALELRLFQLGMDAVVQRESVSGATMAPAPQPQANGPME
ncbi:MAG: hypothetical protein SGJ11_03245 [Phycisphaerae bacterium]|nr:hypothetical protein [Phycisphaerae bacterium]